MIKRTIFALCLGAGALAQADTDSFAYAAGIQATDGQQAGLSFKAQTGADTAVQIVADPFGWYKVVTGRALLDFEQRASWKAYAYGEGGLHLAGSTATQTSETGVHVGTGVGAQYDVRALDAALPPVSLSADLGLSALFMYDASTIDLDIGLGVHYHFNL